MPLRPFPLQLNIGTDIVHAARIRSILAKAETKPQHLERFLRRLLTPLERREFATRYSGNDHTVYDQLDIVSRHLAGRWAAKEATMKAFSKRRLSFHDVILSQAGDRGALRAVILDSSALGGYMKPTSTYGSFGSTGEVSQQPDDDQAMPANGDTPSQLTDMDDIDKADSSQILSRDLDAVASHDDVGKTFDELSGQVVKISISHDGEYATAVCLAADDPGDGDVGGEAAAREPS